ncbi:hypothetical protein PT286_08505 [Neisseriaceae bacterium ESL0693]|nr:hypothetical protein [Neisseriaceae bacterium ESL0693]
MKKKLILLILFTSSLSACLQETELSASATAQTTASEVQNVHQDTVNILDQLNDRFQNETSMNALTASTASSQ